jgi:hypothetical protein
VASKSLDNWMLAKRREVGAASHLVGLDLARRSQRKQQGCIRRGQTIHIDNLLPDAIHCAKLAITREHQRQSADSAQQQPDNRPEHWVLSDSAGATVDDEQERSAATLLVASSALVPHLVRQLLGRVDLDWQGERLGKPIEECAV